MHPEYGHQLFDEGLAETALRSQLRALDAVRQLHDGDHRKTCLGLAKRLPELCEDLRNAVAATLRRDEDTGVEDQFHDVGFQGCRFWTIWSTSAAKSGSSVTA